MKVKTQEAHGVCVLSVKGPMVGGPDNSDRFHAAIDEALQEGHRHFVIDLTACDYVQSPGVGMIMSARTSVLNRDGSLKLVINTERVRNLVNLLQLYRVLEIHETLQAALDSVEASSEA